MDIDKFLDLFGTRRGRWLANRLNLEGTGSEGLANLLSGYAWNMRAAKTLTGVQEMKGHDTSKNAYRSYCAILRQDIKAHPLFHAVSHRISFW
jgi:hypothetical protein